MQLFLMLFFGNEFVTVKIFVQNPIGYEKFRSIQVGSFSPREREKRRNEDIVEAIISSLMPSIENRGRLGTDY